VRNYGNGFVSRSHCAAGGAETDEVPALSDAGAFGLIVESRIEVEVQIGVVIADFVDEFVEVERCRESVVVEAEASRRELVVGDAFDLSSGTEPGGSAHHSKCAVQVLRSSCNGPALDLKAAVANRQPYIAHVAKWAVRTVHPDGEVAIAIDQRIVCGVADAMIGEVLCACSRGSAEPDQSDRRAIV